MDKIKKAPVLFEKYVPYDIVAAEERTRAFNRAKDHDTMISEAAAFDRNSLKEAQERADLEREISERELFEAESTLKSRLQRHMLAETIGKICYEANPVDEEGKSPYMSEIKELAVQECYDVYGSYEKMKRELSPRSMWLENLFINIDKIVEAACDAKKGTEQVLKVDDIDQYEECKVLKGNLDTDMDIESINNAIKEKIIGVVKEEQEASEKRDAIAAEIAAELSDEEMDEKEATPTDAGEETEETVAESYKYRHTVPMQETFSLFRSIAIKKSKEMVQESASTGEHEVKIDQEIMMAETLTEYTLLETLSHLKIYEFKRSDIADMVHKNMHG